MRSIIQIADALWIKVRRLYIRNTAPLRKRHLQNKDFTIISNNCWGGFIYQSYGLKYLTPTLGLFFMAEDYIKFIYNLDKYLMVDDIEPITINQSSHEKYLREIGYHGIIGRLDDIEIMFMHYENIDEAIAKWNERKRRINKNNILFKFCSQNECEEKHIKRFLKFNAPNKICFVDSNYDSLQHPSLYHIRSPKLKTTTEPFGASRIVNITTLINNMGETHD